MASLQATAITSLIAATHITEVTPHVVEVTPLWASVVTPEGYKCIHDIRVGDYVIGSDGKKVKVTQIDKRADKDMYSLQTSDDSRVKCDADHVWTVVTHKDKIKHMTALQLAERIADLSKIYTLPMCAPVEFTPRNAPKVKPYVIGCMIASRSLTHLPDYVLGKLDGNVPDDTTTLICDRITDEYLYASIADRKALLAGLLDVKAVCTKHSAELPAFGTQLDSDIVHLVQSLGGSAMIVSGSIVIKTPHNPFQLPKKADHWRADKVKASIGRRIVSITKLDYYEDVTYITVDAPDNLYLTDSFIVTRQIA